jgi:hypothetical protein
VTNVTSRKPKTAKDLDPKDRSARVKGGVAKVVPSEKDLRTTVHKVARRIGPSR